jgi:hypothetical protein
MGNFTLLASAATSTHSDVVIKQFILNACLETNAEVTKCDECSGSVNITRDKFTSKKLICLRNVNVWSYTASHPDAPLWSVAGPLYSF